jgi:hypothetical protein
MKHSRDCLRYVVLALLLATPAPAATSPDIGPGMSDGEIDHASLGAPRADIPVQGPKAAPKPLVSANPLWAIPLSTLTATRERPLFSPSRRAPTPVVANAPAIPQQRPPPPPAVAQHPDMILVGTVTGETRGVAVFIDTTTRGTIRLRTGEDHKGWTLRSVEARSVTLHKGNTTETLALPPPSGTAGSTPIVSALPPAPPPAPVMAQPVGAVGPEKPVPQPEGCMPDPIGC